MTSIQTAEFGLCVGLWKARQFLSRQGLSVFSSRGAMIFRYPDQEERHVLPVYIQGRGWFYAQAELERDYVKPEPEVISAFEGGHYES